MSFTNPKTWAAEVLTSTDMNAQVRDNINYLKLNIALDTAVELTIASGAVTKTYSHHTITVQSGVTDDLDTISGGAQGEVILIRATDGAKTIILKHNTGNIWNPSTEDVTLDDADDYAVLVYSGSKWCIVGGSSASDLAAHVADTDPHPVYSKADGTRDFSGVVVGVTPTLSSHLATKEYVDLAVANLGFDYYFNDTASGVGSYYKMLDAPTGEAESTFTTGTLTNGDNQLIFGWITATVGALPFDTIHAGIVDFHIHAQKFSGTKPLTLYTTLVERKADTSEFVISTSETSSAITTKASIPLHGSLATDYELTAGSELVCKVYANVGATGNDIVAKVFAEGTTTAHVGVPVATETLSDVFVRKSLYDANTILIAVADDTPAAALISGTTAQKPVTGVNGQIYLDTTLVRADIWIP